MSTSTVPSVPAKRGWFKAQFSLRAMLLLPLLAGLFLIWADQAYDHFILIMSVYGAVFGVFRITKKRKQTQVQRPLAMVMQATTAGFLGGTFAGLFVLPVALSLGMPWYAFGGHDNATLLRDCSTAALGGALGGAILAAAGGALGGALWVLLLNTVFARGGTKKDIDTAGRANQHDRSTESRFGRRLAWGRCIAVLAYPTVWLGHTAWHRHVEVSIRARLEKQGVVFGYGETVGVPWLYKILDRDYSCPLLRRCSSISVSDALADDQWCLIKPLTHLKNVDVILADVDDDQVAVATRSLAVLDLAYVRLDIKSSNITNAALAHLATISSVSVLHISGSGITDEGLAHLQGLRRLSWLSVRGSEVTDAGMIYLTKLPSLRGIDLSGTSVTDDGVKRLCNIVALTDVYLNGCNVTDVGVNHLSSSLSLRYLQLDDTKITDAGLAHLKNVPTLRTLSLARCNVTDDGVGQLQGSGQLYALILDGTAVTDGVAKYLKTMPGLTMVSLKDCDVSDQTITDLREEIHVY